MGTMLVVLLVVWGISELGWTQTQVGLTTYLKQLLVIITIITNYYDEVIIIIIIMQW